MVLGVVDESGGTLDAGAGVVVEEVGLGAENALSLVVHLVAGVAASALLKGTVEGGISRAGNATSVVQSVGSSCGALASQGGCVPGLVSVAGHTPSAGVCVGS